MRFALIRVFFALFLFLAIVSCSSGGYDESANRSIFDFENELELVHLHWECGTFMERDTRHATSGQYSLRLEMYPHFDYPGFKCYLEEGCRGGKRLLVDIYNPGKQAIRLSYRIDDRKDGPPYEDRANGRFDALPGANVFAVELAGLRTSGTGRLMDAASLTSLALFVHQPEKPIVLFFDNIRLEGQ